MPYHKTTHVQFGELMDKKIEEMMKYYSLRSRAEFLRMIVNSFYGEQYRKELIGYAGFKNKNQLQAEADNKVNEMFETANDKDLTSYLRSIEYLTSAFEDAQNSDIFVTTLKDGRYLIGKNRNTGTEIPLYSLIELKEEVIKHLKKK